MGTKAGEDYIKGERESAPDLNNPEVMNQFLQDLIINISGGGIAGSVKTGGKYVPKVIEKGLTKYYKDIDEGFPARTKTIAHGSNLLKKLLPLLLLTKQNTTDPDDF